MSTPFLIFVSLFIIFSVAIVTLFFLPDPEPSPMDVSVVEENADDSVSTGQTILGVENVVDMVVENDPESETELEQPSKPIVFEGERIAGSASPLIDFNETDYQKALASDKLIVLYFYANWCPICKEETTNALYPAFDELTTDQVVGFRVNFNDNQTDETEKSLAKEFGVAYQHTKVFVRNEERILKSPESWSKERYATEIISLLF